MFRILISSVTAFCLSCSALLWPAMSYANSPPAPLQPLPPSEVFTTQWLTKRGEGGVNVISYPKDNWVEIARMTRPARSAADSFAIDLLQGEQWIRNGQFEAGMLGLDSREIAAALWDFKGEQTVVFARYVGTVNALRITAVQMRAFPDGTIRVLKGDYTPWHGERDKAFGKYRTAADKAAGIDGYNPFEAFKARDAVGQPDATNPAFVDLDLAAAQVAVGHAVKHFRADYGVLSTAELSMDRQTSTSGGLLRKRVTTTITGQAKIRWLMVTPVGAMRALNTNSSAICVVTPSGQAGQRTTMCDAPEHLAMSGVEFEEMTGGTMPVGKTDLTQEVIVKKSFSVLTFAIFAFALAAAGGFAWLAATGGLSGGLTSAVLFQIGPLAVTPGIFGAMVGGAYMVASTVLGSGGALTQAQTSLFGSTGNGVLQAGGPSGQHDQVLRDTARQVLIASGVDQNQIPQVKALYSGANCTETMTEAQCIAAGGNATAAGVGLIPRVDKHQSPEPVSRSLKARASDCANLVGAAYRRCLAPVANNPNVIGQ